MRVEKETIRAEYRAYAKVNLALAVGGLRPDGYHDISTVMVPVGIFDLVSVRAEPAGMSSKSARGDVRAGGDAWGDPRAGLEVYLSCPGLPDVPPQKNLAYIAASRFLGKTGARLRVSISVDKRIPPGAGLGGGSSDAAAVLAALNCLARPEHRLSAGDLLSIAASVGADVPFLVGCNLRPPLWEGALCTGIGEKVRPVHIPNMWLVIAFPDAPVSTGQAYALLDSLRNEGKNPSFSPALSYRWTSSCARSSGVESGEEVLDGRVREFLDVLSSGDIHEVSRALFNDLELAAVKIRPEIARLKRMFYDCGALGASMTGSGSAVFGIAGSKPEAEGLRTGLECVAARAGLRLRDVIVVKTGVEHNGC
ncbi:MAG TPA: hypothetical protein GX500_04700 [Firmicutes bacterium]|nr:hypothetical protein [Candidatus Fermentithermobacillaceae bacterium]